MLVLGWIFGVAFSGCGYRFGEAPSNWSAAGRSLWIPVFTNDSMELGAETLFVSAARRAFAGRRAFTMADADDAEFVLRGRIRSLDLRPLARREAETGSRVALWVLSAEVDVKLLDRAGLTVWERSLRDRIEVLGSGLTTAQADNRQTATAQLAERIMRRAYAELTEGR